jgi:hypothetical protein
LTKTSPQASLRTALRTTKGSCAPPAAQRYRASLASVPRRATPDVSSEQRSGRFPALKKHDGAAWFDVQFANALERGTAVARGAIAGLAMGKGTLRAHEIRSLGARHELREPRVQHRGKKGNSNAVWRRTRCCTAEPQSGRGSTIGEGIRHATTELGQLHGRWLCTRRGSSTMDMRSDSDAFCDAIAEAVGQKKICGPWFEATAWNGACCMCTD